MNRIELQSCIVNACVSQTVRYRTTIRGFSLPSKRLFDGKQSQVKSLESLKIMNKIALLKTSFRAIIFSSFLLSMPISGQASVTDEAYRKELTQEIVDNWKGKNPATSTTRWEAGIRVWLNKLSTDDLLNAHDAATYEDMTVLLSSKTQNLGVGNSLNGVAVVTGKAYYALNPCRIVDTRLAFGAYTGPIIGQGAAMNFHAKDALEIQNQGGKPGGCNVPPTATALVINITSVNQSGNGHLRAFPFGAPTPLASILNFTDTAIANSTILPVCTGTCGADFSIYTSNSTQVVVDVMGYFAD